MASEVPNKLLDTRITACNLGVIRLISNQFYLRGCSYFLLKVAGAQTVII